MRVGLLLLLLVALPYRSPAPADLPARRKGGPMKCPAQKEIGTGEGEGPLDVAQKAFDQKKYRLALKASQRVVKVWLSDYSPQAQYLIRPLLRGTQAG